MTRRRTIPLLLATLVVGASVAITQVATAGARTAHSSSVVASATPIKHVVVIFQENVSFDHYFGTYPNAANTGGPDFTAKPGTPALDGLLPATDSSLPRRLRHSRNLVTNNPNSASPQRLDSSPTGLAGSAGGQLTCDQDHNYSDEQKAFDNGKMDTFVESVGNGGGTSPFGTPCTAKTVMDYYDGNTVTGLWNYAQNFSMSDDSFGTTFGPSSPGAINLASGNTGGVDTSHEANSPSIATPTAPNAHLAPDGKGGYSLTSDAQPYWDDCSTGAAVAMTGQNIGDKLNQAGISWGWFQGGMRPSTSYADALTAVGAGGQSTSTFTPDQFSSYFLDPTHRPAHSSNQNLCSTVHPVGVALGGTGQWMYKDDYIPHHEPFNYYVSTANPHHLAIPTDGAGQDTLAGLKTIGSDTQSYVGGVPQLNTPNHQYDSSDFDQLVSAITNGELPASALPAVSFLKAPGYQDGHGAYSDPADEQQFIIDEINALERSPDWSSTAVIVSYDDSDGWYDHVYSGITNKSLSPADNLTKTTLSGPTSGQCGPAKQGKPPLGGEQGRCGFGPRLPLLVISRFAAQNAVDHNLSDQSSILNFIEYNWHVSPIAGSFDQALAKTDQQEGVNYDLQGLFDFGGKRAPKLLLNPLTGQPIRRSGS